MTYTKRREKHLTNYIFLRRLNYPSLISPPPPQKLKHKLHNSKKLTENNTLPPNKLLQKFSLKKILLQKLQLIQISDVTRTNPEHIINKKKL